MGIKKLHKVQLNNKNVMNNNGFLSMQEVTDFIHNEKNGGFVSVCTREKRNEQYIWTEKCYSLNDWIEHITINETIGCFTSMSSSFVPKRSSNTVREISWFFVDLDTRNVGLSKEAAIEGIKFLEKNERIPAPTMIIDSGGGLYVLWKIESVPGKYSSVQKLFNHIEVFLIDQLKELGSDESVKDVARVLRIPGTFNEKYSKEVSVIEFEPNKVYTMRFFQEFMNDCLGIDLIEFKKKTPKRKKVNSKIKRLFNFYTLAISRSRDIEKIIELRKYDVVGLRNQFIHIYGIEQMRIHKDKNIMKMRVNELNNQLLEPLDKRDIIDVTNSVYQNYLKWNYRNQTIIKKLQITIKEQREMTTLISEVEKNERKKEKNKKDRRDKDGLTSRERSKVELIEKVKELHSKGLKQREIADKLGIHKSNVSRYLKL